MTLQTYTFHIHGIHCNACVLLTEAKVGDLPNVTSVRTILRNHTMEITGDFGDLTPEQIAEEFTKLLKPHGYTISLQKQESKINLNEFAIALPLALGFALLFILLQRVGLINLVSAGNITYGTAFMIGIIASLSTCMAVVGGLVLSMSATFAKQGDRIKPQLMFHSGRIMSFFILGGIIGALGSAFTLSPLATFILASNSK